MNKTRRNELAKIQEEIKNIKEDAEALKEKVEELKGKIEAVRDEEESAYDNLPESFQEGERGEQIEDSLGYAVENLQGAIDA